MKTLSVRSQVPLNLFTLSSLSLFFSAFLSTAPSVVATELEYRGLPHAHHHAHKPVHLNQTQIKRLEEESARRKRFTKRVLPEDWSEYGCVADGPGPRVFDGSSQTTSDATHESCVAFCDTNGYYYAGLEFGNECYCANPSTPPTTVDTGCTMACAGDSEQFCGGPNRMTVLKRDGTPPVPEVVETHDVWTSVGCYTDSVSARTLSTPFGVSIFTVGNCLDTCKFYGFSYGGVENGAECYCGNAVANGSPSTTGCNKPCAGSSAQICGGPNYINVYAQAGAPPPGGGEGGGEEGGGEGEGELPEGWTAAGCYTDSVAVRSLTGATMAAADMTHQKCINFCATGNFIYAGAEYGVECFCGNTLVAGAPATDGCTMACAGDATQICGGPDRMSLFLSDGTPPPEEPEEPEEPTGPAVEVPSYGEWTSEGCTVDMNPGRSLPVGMGVVGAMTIEKCLDACFNAGYGYAGTEYAAECFCGETPGPGATPATDGCTMACAGNAEQLCGGPNRLNMYSYGGDDLPPIGGGGPGPGGPGEPGDAPPPVTENLPEPWHYDACWVDQQFGRVLTYAPIDDPARTVEQCIDICSTAGYSIAGLEYGVQCFCGNEMRYAATVATNENDCNMPCGGDAEHACGAGNRLSVYTTLTDIPVYPVPTPKTTDLPGNWEYQGCFEEVDPALNQPRVYLHQILFEEEMSPEKCLNQCAKYGYLSAGFQFGYECYCGDPEDYVARGTPATSEAQCNTACTDAPGDICGGPLRISIYDWVGGGLTVWHEPANPGHYEFLIGAPMVALQTSLGINGKVTFLEKLGSGPENSTHAYELDYSLAHDPENAWREMHVQTDIFCAAGVILPDKAGRQINVAGWSLDSTFGTRFYTPDGSPGVPGTNDWEEDVSILSLQRGRWYPSAMILSNGSILVVGGQIGANDLPEPTLEVLPKPVGGPTYLHMDWLERSDPWNLYPFMHILPSGGIYIQYWHEAIILDPETFDTLVQLPNLPGSVDNKAGGRTYPLEGSGIMFPIHAPYTDPVTMLSCGGSDEFYGLDNCVSLQPEVEGAEWTIERMPFPRVLSMMVALPDGTFLIVGGARQGQAGFGLAVEPVLTALLYDPTQPLGERISILGETIVARMYHSEAILLHDGRVMISGSDPLDPRFPEEHRVEVYIPPYLASGLPQPTFTITQTDWVYDGTYTVTITSSTTANIRASLLGAETSTHGYNMGQRTIFPAISCTGAVCTITAPPDNKICPPGWFQLFILDGPTPSHSAWVRIGGDPAQLGLWPDLPGFTVPGM